MGSGAGSGRPSTKTCALNIPITRFRALGFRAKFRAVGFHMSRSLEVVIWSTTRTSTEAGVFQHGVWGYNRACRAKVEGSRSWV